jgi:hypothetical protein
MGGRQNECFVGLTPPRNDMTNALASLGGRHLRYPAFALGRADDVLAFWLPVGVLRTIGLAPFP